MKERIFGFPIVFTYKSVADPGFPIGGGGADPLGGCQPLMCTLFSENVCENERN